MIKLSIIIPFYNVEKYFKQCLESIVNQTLKETEIILVNDGSTDDSAEIASYYALTDDRIKIITIPERKGQGYARNRALEIVSGEYTGFVDSDDFTETYMFEHMYNKAKEADTDITFCASRLYDDASGEFYTDDYYSLKPLEKFSGTVFNVNDVKDEILDINVVLWNKIYKTEFLKSSGIFFPEGFIYEDLPFFFETFLKAKRVNILWESPYIYRQNRTFSSSTMQNSDKKVYDRIPMVEKTYNLLKQLPYFEEKKPDIAGWIIDDIFHRYTVLEDKYYEDYYAEMKGFFSRLELTDEDKEKLRVSYCYDEFCAILESSYYGFWRFLIDKYKTTNKRIKAAEHKCNLDIIDIKNYIEEYKSQVKSEKEETEKYWENRLVEFSEMKKNEMLEKLKFQFEYLKAKKHANMKKIYNKLEYKFNRQLASALKKQKEKIKEEYELKLNQRENYYTNALYEQKKYYENNFFAIKIEMNLRKKIAQTKNKIKRILKTN